MKFCNPAFLENITGSLTCGNASATGAIMDELGWSRRYGGAGLWP